MGKNALEKNLLYETILEHVSGTVFVTDCKGRIVYSNQAAAKALGCSVEELLKMDIYELEDKGMTSGAVSIQVLEQQKAMTANVHYYDGKETIVMGEPVLNEEGELRYVVVYGQKKNVLSERIQILEKEKGLITQTLSHLLKDKENATLIAVSKVTLECMKIAAKAAKLDSTVMLYGETGSGKEVFANYIHEQSNRKEKLFLAVNCAAIPSELMESEFFGYERGAFTGANVKGKSGLFELANEGTLFLDEIGELTLPLQSKLLRVLESGEFQRVGGTKVLKTNVRIIGATNRNLKEMSDSGKFREDLYYRLNVIPINIPPLRERKEDIMELAVFFLGKLNKKYSQEKYFPTDSIDILCAYDWPGNIRELRNIIERAFVLSSTDCITKEQISNVLGGKKFSAAEKSFNVEEIIDDFTEEYTLKEITEKCQRQYIGKILDICKGDVVSAAKMLGVSRSGLYKKIEKLGMMKRTLWIE